MKNTFHKGIIALGQDLEGLAIDLQAWFKRLSCKEDDFKELSDKTISKCSATCQQKMVDAIPGTGRIVKRWDDAEEYFLN